MTTSTTPKITQVHGHSDDSLAGLFRLTLRYSGQAVARWYRRRGASYRLHDLDDRMLKDIGIHRSEIESVLQEPRHHRDRSKF